MRWERVGAALAVVVVIFSLYLSDTATSDAHAASVEATVLAETARQLALTVARTDYDRAVGLCKSNTDLRLLLDDISAVVVPKSDLEDPAVKKFLKRVDTFGATNPACSDFPPNPAHVAPVKQP